MKLLLQNAILNLMFICGFLVISLRTKETALIKDTTVYLEALLGKLLAKLPIHVKLGKMLLFGALFKCLDKALTIAY